MYLYLYSNKNLRVKKCSICPIYLALVRDGAHLPSISMSTMLFTAFMFPESLEGAILCMPIAVKFDMLWLPRTSFWSLALTGTDRILSKPFMSASACACACATACACACAVDALRRPCPLLNVPKRLCSASLTRASSLFCRFWYSVCDGLAPKFKVTPRSLAARTLASLVAIAADTA